MLSLFTESTNRFTPGLIIMLLLVFTVVILTGLLIYLYLKFRKLQERISSSSLKETLKENDLFEQLLNNIPDRIYFKDRESRFILANSFVSLTMGEKDPAKLVGKTDFDFYERRHAQPYYDDEQEVMKTGIPIIAKEERGVNIEGKEIIVSTTKIPVRDRYNKVVGIMGIGRDISAQKNAETALKEQTEQLKEINVLLEERKEEIQQMAEELNVQAENLREANIELERLSLVASQTENVVIIMDGNANFIWVNQGFETRYNQGLKSFISAHGHNLRENSSNDNISGILNQVNITKKPFTYNSRSISMQGEEVWNQTNISPIVNQDGEITYLVLIDSDITDLKNAEQQIKKQHALIEKRTEELQVLNATKDRLFSIIAHDLKNPFHSIMGFTDLLQKSYKEISREKLNEFLEMINISTRSAYQLLENLLEWARSQTESTQFEPEDVKVRDIVIQNTELLHLHAESKDISFKEDVKEDAIAFADKNMLNTVIRNITGNAIKYTNQGGEISFRSTLKKDGLVLEISDTGVGMPQEKINDLFKLDKVSSTAGTVGETGTGLGLIVCNDFMTKNKGTIEVSSQPGKGTTFRLILPIKKQE